MKKEEPFPYECKDCGHEWSFRGYVDGREEELVCRKCDSNNINMNEIQTEKKFSVLDEKNRKYKEILGCTAVLDKEGVLWVCKDLKTHTMIGTKDTEYPLFTVMGIDLTGSLLLSPDGFWVSTFIGKVKIR